MKVASLFKLTIPVMIILSACSKDKSRENGLTPPQQQKGLLVRIQQGIDPDLANDSVFLISYKPSGEINALVDSINHDTLVPSYDASGNITSITDHSLSGYPDNASFTYDANNLLTQINYHFAGSNESYIFEYSNGVVSKKSYYSDLGTGGASTLQVSYTYAIAGGNITDIKEFTAAGVQTGETSANYGTQPNTLKSLSLFNYANRLGMGSFLNDETWFNKNMVTSLIISNPISTITNNYSYNSIPAPAKIESNHPSNGTLFTWFLSYN